jgi:hypothetical protein
MQISFTKHAVERLQERLNIRVPANVAIDIGPLFVKVHTYVNTTNGRVCEAYCSKDRSKQVVLIVDQLKQAVVTIYTGKGVNTSGLTCRYVDEMYALMK